ncbi:hypothetical protein LTR66_008944 [Elasticomyces elasticus]|nr:hypothetical protein LTR66_008944 [Elasticomyces elasticus]
MSSTSKPATVSSTSQWPVTAYHPRHQTWPYKTSDFTRSDPSSDSSFYDAPRFVTHIDDHAIASLRAYYAAVLPREGRILDFCSSWISHYPPAIEDAVKKGELQVVGMGMNKAELDANPILSSRLLHDLNEVPEFPYAVIGSEAASEALDASTCVVSIDYLTSPREILTSLLQRTNKGGTVHLAVSNRCFPTKVVSRWLRVSEDERLQMVGDYLWFAGWRSIEIVDLSGKDEEDEQPDGGALQRFMRSMGMGAHDPIWVVRGTKE